MASDTLNISPLSFALATLSLAKASDKTVTRGPLPDKKIVSLPTPIALDLSVAILRPTKVLPAPGTPVTKQIALSRQK